MLWQHHLLSVYHTDIDGDTATALTYHTSYQLPKDDPEHVLVLVGRYHQGSAAATTGWQADADRVRDPVGRTPADIAGYLAAVGGRRPPPDPVTTWRAQDRRTGRSPASGSS